MRFIVPFVPNQSVAWGALPVLYTSDHDSGADPVGQGWTGSEIVIGVDTSPVDGLIDMPFNAGPVDGTPGSAVAWQTHDQLFTGATNLPRYSYALSPSEQDLLVTAGWEFTAKVRLVRKGDDSEGPLVGWALSSQRPTHLRGSIRCQQR